MNNGNEPKPMPEDLELGPKECNGSIIVNQEDFRMIINPMCDQHARMAVLAYARSLSMNVEENLSPSHSPLSTDGDFTLSEYLLLSLNDVLTEEEHGITVLIVDQEELKILWKSLSLRTLTLQTTITMRSVGKEEVREDLEKCKGLMEKLNLIVQETGNAEISSKVSADGSHKTVSSSE